MIIKKSKVRKFFREVLRWFGMLLLSLLAMSGFIRFVELNTTCEGFNSYYEFQDIFCEKSGFLNYKIKCDIPVYVELNCVCDFGLFSFPVARTEGFSYNSEWLKNVSFD